MDIDEEILEKITRLVHTIVLSIIDREDVFEISVEVEKNTILFEVSALKEDAAKLIGTKGRIADSIRSVVKASGAKHGVRALVNIMKVPLLEAADV